MKSVFITFDQAFFERIMASVSYTHLTQIKFLNMTENLIIFNARVVTPIGFSARCGKEMGLSLIHIYSTRQ